MNYNHTNSKYNLVVADTTAQAELRLINIALFNVYNVFVNNSYILRKAVSYGKAKLNTKLTLLKSPHTHKKSRDQIEINTLRTQFSIITIKPCVRVVFNNSNKIHVLKNKLIYKKFKNLTAFRYITSPFRKRLYAAKSMHKINYALTNEKQIILRQTHYNRNALIKRGINNNIYVYNLIHLYLCKQYYVYLNVMKDTLNIYRNCIMTIYSLNKPIKNEIRTQTYKII